MNLKNEAEVSTLFDMIGNECIYPFSNEILMSGENWLQEKRASFHGGEYFDKIETNAIYLSESVNGACQVLARFLHDGKPEIYDDVHLNQYMMGVRNYFGRLNIYSYLTFIREGDWPTPRLGLQRGVLSKFDPVDLKQLGLDIKPITEEVDRNKFVGLREMRLSGNMPRYIEELEFSCKFLQSSLAVSGLYLKAFNIIPGIACSAKNIDVKSLLGVVTERIRSWTAICTQG